MSSECFENVLTRKIYSTPVYLIKNFEIGQVVLELGHFKDGVPKNEKSKKFENDMKKFSSRKIIAKSYGEVEKSKFWISKKFDFSTFFDHPTSNFQIFEIFDFFNF